MKKITGIPFGLLDARYQGKLTFPLAASLGGTGVANGASATLTLPDVALTLAASGAYTVTIPESLTLAGRDVANVFTEPQTVSVPEDTDGLVLTDESGVTKAAMKWAGNTVTLDIPSVEPTNKLLNSDFENDLTGWNSPTTPVEVTNSNGDWVLVPGDETFGTDDFYVMKYEAKYDNDDDGVGNVPADFDPVASADSGAGLDYRDIAGFDKENVVSSAEGAPLVHITQTQAISACPTGYHLISNAEWMTIARNAEAQASNWANGVVGSTVAAGGGMFRGNVGEATSVGYNASTDPDYGTSRDSKAKLTLSNGAEIWDLSGNVWAWNSDVQTEAINTTAGWVDWNHANIAAGAVDLYGPAGGYLSAHGMGQVYGGALNNAFLRGGAWLDTSYAGAFTLYLVYTPGSQYFHVGFRCASDPAFSYEFDTNIKYGGNQSIKIAVGSCADLDLTQSVNVGDTAEYTLIAYAYTNGGAVTSVDVELYYDNDVLETNYTSMGGGWYRLTGTLTGVASAKDYGVRVKAGKTVYCDSFSLQAGLGTTTTLSVGNSGTGNLHHEWEGMGTFHAGIHTESASIDKGAVSQSENIKEFQNSAGTVLSGINKDGNLFIGSTILTEQNIIDLLALL